MLIPITVAIVAAALQTEIRVVFKADDMGAAHAINAGTIEAYRNGVVTSTDVIVPGPWFVEAAKLLKENPGLDVGVHLCLTSEWEGVKWRPLTGGKSFVDKDGNFLPMVWPNKNFPPGSFLLEAKIDLAEVERELRAQIETAKRHIPRISFLSCHMGAASATPELKALTERLSKEYGLPVQDFQKSAKWMPGIYAGTDSGSEKARKLAAALEKLEPGTYIHLEHGALDTPEMRAIGHEGYRNVAADRERAGLDEQHGEGSDQAERHQADRRPRSLYGAVGVAVDPLTTSRGVTNSANREPFLPFSRSIIHSAARWPNPRMG
jgi:chitin disaccharide deacetylase